MRYLKVLKQYWPILLLTLCFFIFYSSVIVGGKVFFCCDNLLINIPAKVFLASELSQGRLPLWNPYILSGMPFLADINLSLLFPTTLLYLLLSPFAALSIGILSCIFFSMIGMYGLVTAVTRSRFAGVISALLWTCSGTMITYINNVPMLQVLAIMPWVVWMLLRYLSRRTSLDFVWLILVLTLSIFGGHPQFIYYTWALVVVIVLTHTEWSWMDRWMLLGKLFVYCVGLSAVQLLPFVELASLSTRLGKGFDYSSAGSLHPASLVRFLLPTIVGNDASGTSWILGGSINGYIGCLGLLLALWASKRQKLVVFFWTVALVSFFLALGRFTPLYKLAYFTVPGLALLRSPENLLVLVTFALCVLAGWGTLRMRTHTFATKRVKLWMGGLGVVLVISLVAARLGGAGEKLLAWAWVLPQMLQSKVVALGSVGVTGIWEAVWQNVLVEACLGTLFVWVISKKRKVWLYSVALAGLVFVELLVFVSPAMIIVGRTQAREWLYLASQTARRVIVAGGAQTMFTDPKSYPYQHPHVFGQPYWPAESAWQAYILRPNIHMMYGFSSPDGYASTVLRTYQQRVSPDSTDPTGVNLSTLFPDTLKALGVKALVTTQGATGTGEVRVLPVAGADRLHCDACVVTSAAQLSSELRATVEIERYTTVQTNIAFYPGWEVTIDGQKTGALNENGLLAAAVPAGTHTLAFRYASPWTRVGIGMSIITALSLLFHLRRRKSVREQEVQNRKHIQGAKRRDKK